MHRFDSPNLKVNSVMITRPCLASILKKQYSKGRLKIWRGKAQKKQPLTNCYQNVAIDMDTQFQCIYHVLIPFRLCQTNTFVRFVGFKPILKIFLCDPWTTKAFISSCIIHLVAFRHGAPSSKCFRRSASRYRSNMRWIPRRRQDVLPEFPTVYSFFWGGAGVSMEGVLLKWKNTMKIYETNANTLYFTWFWDFIGHWLDENQQQL